MATHQICFIKRNPTIWRMIGIAMALHGEAANAQAATSNWIERIGIYVEGAGPVATAPNVQVRLPAVSEPANGYLPPVLMPKMLASEAGSFFARATADLVIGGDDSQGTCHTAKAIILRGTPRTEAMLPLDVCGLLGQSVHFRHALAVDGKPLASKVRVEITFRRYDIALPSAPPPAFMLKTFGHVLNDTGRWIDGDVLANDLSLDTPNWATALPDRKNLPIAARVGVMLKLTAKDGVGMVGGCSVEMTSSDARIDAATCKALSTSGYSNRNGKIYSWTLDYPVVVQWHGDAVNMTAPALPTVPHMPKDVTLTNADRLTSTPPGTGVIPIRINLDDNGHAAGCTVMRSSGDDGWDAASCRLAMTRARFTAARDWFDRPAKGLYEVAVDWPNLAIRPGR